MTVEDRVTPVASLVEFFKDAVADAMQRQNVRADDHTSFYVVNLLALFARSEALFDPVADRPSLRPLAAMLADAVWASDRDERNFALQRLGDVSLFIAGFFGDGFATKPVDVDYYVQMGGSAYDSLSGNLRGTVRGRAYGAVFAELAAKFQDFVDVLSDVRDQAQASHDVDVLRLYELWLRTRSNRAARLLRLAGVEPNQLLDAEFKH
ncbi:MAG TPA: hypothetical protein VF322_05535 [Gammaproteobacteria bacterium]